MAVDNTANLQMSESLEDYLETIYHLVKQKKVARVKDIAAERSVSMASVSTAMRRLADLDLIHYRQREYIELTPKGESVVRRIVTRHEIMHRFFTEILQVDDKIADEDACQIEHHISDQTVDRLVRLLEFLENCEDGRNLLQLFQSCHTINPELGGCVETCERRRRRRGRETLLCTLADLKPGSRALVARIQAKGAVRQRLIDMGMLPHTEIEVERVAPSGDPIWIRIRGFNLSLRKHEAAGIMVNPV
ncbi:MAG: DtxR family transcriptional regulator [Candidatus Lernaella stagnicola]|nr:DtxR family transcriptional regulator [Candidatus Lernaella stagnicola]